MKLAKRIARRIQELREAAGLSQQEVAVKGDLSLSLIAKMEQGKKADPRASTILALGKALGVRPGELLDPVAAALAAEAAAPPAAAEPAETPGTTANGADGQKKKKKDKKKKKPK